MTDPLSPDSFTSTAAMFSGRCRGPRLSIWVFLAPVTLSLVSSIKVTPERIVYEQRPEFHARYISNYFLWTKTDLRIWECVKACESDTRCVSFFYKPKKKECSGRHVEFSSSDIAVSRERKGTKYFARVTGPEGHCRGLPVAPTVTEFTVNSVYIDSPANYTCAEGYEDTGSGQVTCQKNKTWSEALCEGVECGAPNPPPHTEIGVSSITKYPNNIIFVCITDYDSNGGEDTISCQANGTWTLPSIECTIVVCGPPPIITEMVRSFENTVFRSTATYTCSLGYTGDGGNGTSTCLHSGEWTPPGLVCTIRDCGTPPSPPDSTTSLLEYSITTYGSQALYECTLGYVPKTPMYPIPITCTHDGTWDISQLTCDGAPGILETRDLGDSSLPDLTCVTRTTDSTETDGNKWKPVINCLDDEVVTSCNTKMDDYAPSYFTGFGTIQQCNVFAADKREPDKIFAILSARCCKLRNLRCELYSFGAGAQQCQKNFTMVGCNGGVKLMELSFRGSKLTSSTCESIEGNSNSGETLIACCSAPGLTCVLRTSSPSSVGATDILMACEVGEVLTGCALYGSSGYIRHYGTFFTEVDGVTHCGAKGNPGLVIHLHCCKA